VQVDTIPQPALLAALQAGVDADGERLRARSATLLRAGERNAWLEIVLDEGRNRQIRRLLAAFDVAVLRLVRVAIGGLALGELAKGQWRELTPEEQATIVAPSLRR
jgi:23S rRNA pseudouridine2605 synthase